MTNSADTTLEQLEIIAPNTATQIAAFAMKLMEAMSQDAISYNTSHEWIASNEAKTTLSDIEAMFAALEDADMRIAKSQSNIELLKTDTKEMLAKLRTSINSCGKSYTES